MIEETYWRSPTDRSGTKIHIKRGTDTHSLCRHKITARWSAVEQEPPDTHRCVSCLHERIQRR